MNTTRNISLAGYSFIIEEEAYHTLASYLDLLKRTLSPEEADEVMADIETRISEILKENLGRREVVDPSDIETIISTLGKPEEIEESLEGEGLENETLYTPIPLYSREFFRDPIQKKIAGVCAGLAAYSGLSVTAMRAIWLALFIILFFSHPPAGIILGIIYLALWAILPTAKSASDFLKMRGAPVTFSSLKNQVTAGPAAGKMNAPKYPLPHRNDHTTRVILSILGIFSLLMGLSFATASIVSVSAFAGSSAFIHENIAFFTQNPHLGKLGLALVVLTTLIPAFLFIVIGIRLISPKTKLRGVWWVFGSLILLWLITVGITSGTAIQTTEKLNAVERVSENISLSVPGDTLIISEKKVSIPSHYTKYWGEINSDGKNIIRSTQRYIDIQRDSTITQPFLEVKKEGAETIDFRKYYVPVEVIGNELILPSKFRYPATHRLIHSSVRYILHAPTNMHFQLKNTDYFIMDEENTQVSGSSQNKPSATTDPNATYSDSLIIRTDPAGPSVKIYPSGKGK